MISIIKRMFSKLTKSNKPVYTDADGTKTWWLNNKLHREDGPAVEYANETKAWYINGKRHRTAIEYQKAANLSDEAMTVLVLKYGEIK